MTNLNHVPRLGEAAGDLYSALEKIVDCYGVGYKEPARFCQDVYDWMIEGQHALAKARGEI